MNNNYHKQAIHQYKLVLIVLFISFANILFAAPPVPSNDNPCNATPLTVVTTACTPPYASSYTNVGATSSPGVPAPGCAAYSGGDVWFQVTVPAGGALNFNSSGGTMSDGGMAIYSGTCGSLSLISCNDDSYGLMPCISSTGLTPGATIWIRFWGLGGGTGTFGLCILAPPPPPPPGLGTSCATPACPGTYPTLPAPTGIPSMGSGGIYGCLGSTPNPIWNIFQANTSSPVTVGVNSSNGADIDYVMWGPFSSPAAGCAGISAGNIVSCNYSTAGLNSFTFTPVNGQFYILLTTNYSTQAGITFNWPISPAGSISCPNTCTVTATATPSSECVGAGTNIVLSVTTPVANATNYAWTGPNGFASSGISTNATISAPTAAAAGTYSLTATSVIAGSTATCNSTVSVAINPLPSITNAPAPQTVCPGTLVSYTPTITPALGATYSWTATASSTNIGGYGSVGSIPISNVLTNIGTTSETVTYVITPIGAATSLCHGTPVNYVVTVDPKPTITNPPAIQFNCAGTLTTYSPTSNLPGVTYTWTAISSSPNLGGYTASGSGNINDVITNSGTTMESVTYAITPHGLAPGLCPGTPVNLIAYIIPAPSVAVAGTDQNICINNGNLSATTPLVGSATWTTLSGSGTISNISDPNSTVSGLSAGANLFQWTITNAPCPASIDSVLITVDPAPLVTNVPLTQEICSGSNATLSLTSNVNNATFSWTATASSNNITGFTASGNGNINDAITTTDVTSGTITYVITPTGPAPALCPGTPSNFVVTIDPIPTITNLTLTQSSCSGIAAVFNPTSNVAGTTFSWTASSPDAGVSGFSASGNGPINQVVTNSGNAVGTITYVITPIGPTPSLCHGPSVNFVVSIDPAPTVTNSPLTQAICSGLQATLNPIASNVANATFIWTATSSSSNVTGYSANGNGNILETVSNSGNTSETITYAITASSPGLACAGNPAFFVVTVDPIPTITNASLAQTICAGTPDNFIPTSNITSGTTTYSWMATASSGNIAGFSINGNGPINETITNSGATSETVTYTITPTGPASTSCIGSLVNFVVTVDPTPIVTNAVLTQNFCSGGTASFTPTVSPATSTYNWTTTATAGITGFANNGTTAISDVVSNSGNVSGTVTYTITPTGPAPSFCVGTPSNFIVTVDPIPHINNPTLTQTICAGGTASFIPSATVVGSTFAWTATASSPNVTGFTANGSGTISDIINNSGLTTETITYVITPTGPSPNFCSSGNTNFVVTINPPPAITNPASALTQTICSGTNATFTPTSSVGGTTYSWTATAAGGTITGFSPIGNGNINETISNTGTTAGTVTYMVTPATTCQGLAVPFVVTVNPIPVPIVANTGPVCVGNSIGLTTTPAGATYAWAGPAGFVSAAQNPNISNAATAAMTGAYTVSLTINNCTGTATTNVIINPLPVATVSGNAQTCAGTNAPDINIQLTGSPPWNITYSNGITNSVVSAPATPYSIVNPSAGTYTVTSVSDGNGCVGTSTGSATIVINPLPVVAFTPNITSGCAPLCVNYMDATTVSSGGPIASWSWDFGGDGTSTQQNPNHCFNNGGSYSTTLTATSTVGCHATQVYTNLINALSTPVASFSAPQTVSILTPTVTFIDNSSWANTWAWNFGDTYNPTTDTSHQQNSIHTYSSTGHYCVKLTVSNSVCYDTASVCFDVEPEFSCYIPNAFTPNHDGLNDLFYCNAVNVLEFEMNIFDRWGNSVFVTNDQKIPWDGSIKGGAIAEEDVYVYVIKITDTMKEKHQYIGNITLVR